MIEKPRVEHLLTIETMDSRPGDDERFDSLLTGHGFRLERIVSSGHRTPDGQWYDQPEGEWVLLVSGSAVLRFEQGGVVPLGPGDCVNIPAHCRHRVEQTDAVVPTVWLALHYDE